MVILGLTALSRNSFCSLVRGRRRLVEEGCFNDSGRGSVEGCSADVVIEAC